MPEVSEVTFISADEALEDAKDIYNTEFLDGLKDDNLFTSFNWVKTKGH